MSQFKEPAGAPRTSPEATVEENEAFARGARRCLMVTCASMLRNDGYTVHVWMALRAIRRVQGEAGKPPVLLNFESARFWLERSARERFSTLAEERGVVTMSVPLLPKRLPWSVWLNDWWCAMWIRIAARRYAVEVVHAQSHVAAAAVARALRDDRSRDMVFDVHGVDIEEAVEDGRIHFGSAVYHLRLDMQRAALARADWVFPVTRALADHLLTAGGTGGRFHVIPCLLQRVHAFEDTTRARDATRSRLGLGDRAVVLYVGSASSWQRAGFMIEVFAELKQRLPGAFLLIVSGTESQFRQLATSGGLGEADFQVMSLPHDEVWQVSAAGDVGLLFRDDTLVNRVASPTKFAEYLSCGVPVAVSEVIADGAALVAERRVGLAVSPDLSAGAVAHILAEFLGSPQHTGFEARRRCVETARQLLTLESALPAYREVYSPGQGGAQAGT